MIEFSQVKEIFDSLTNQPGWNLEGPLRWNYFFADSSSERLQNAATALIAQGYRQISLAPDPEAEPDTPNALLYLQVQKDEIHTAETLHERNQQLDAFAKAHKLLRYDGMDASPLKSK